ncbi:MAG: hypothetical protein ACI86M_001618 [Saprospiraceae bacterium]|jgi:hypothetical protein
MGKLSNFILKIRNQWTNTTWAIFSFFIISMLMQWTMAQFEKKVYLSTLQFGFDEKADAFEDKREILFENFDYEWLFFIPDMFFLLSICWIIGIFYKKMKTQRNKEYVSYDFFFWALIFFGILSILFDWYENFQYFFGSKYLPYFSQVETFKVSLVSILLALTLLYGVLHFSNSGMSKECKNIDRSNSLIWEPKKMLKLFMSASISILLLIVIGLGLTMLDQGATLVVHLIDQADQWHGFIQIVMTVLLINLLAVMLSHYPEYIQRALGPSKKTRWHINWIFKFIPGLITFTNSHYDDKEESLYDVSTDLKNDPNAPIDPNRTKYANWGTIFRYFLGVMTYIAWFYVMYQAFDLYSLASFDAGSSVTLWSVLVCVIIYCLYRAHSIDSKDLIDEINTTNTLDPNVEQTAVISKEAIDKVKPWVRGYQILLWCTIVLGVGAMIVFAVNRWNVLAFYASIIFLLFNTFLFVFFRFTRFYQKYVLFSSYHVLFLLKKDKEASFVGNSKIKLVIENGATDNYLKKLYGNVSSSYYFLCYIRAIAFLAGAYLGWSYFTMGNYITDFNAIPLTLAFLVMLYIVIIYPIKFYLAYGRRQYNERETEDEAETDIETGTKSNFYRRKKKYIWALCSIGALIFISIKVGQIANLHKLFYVDSLEYETVRKFTTGLDEYIEKNMVVDCNTVTPMLRITSFGGGLKSNLWTLLTMNELDRRIKTREDEKTSNTRFDNKRILDYTISLSGVSGGAVGLGNYLVLDYLDKISKSYYNRDSVIRNIGEENILAIDVSGIFGHDKIKQTFTWSADSSNQNKDRSYYAMQRYMKALNKTEDCAKIEELSESSLSEFWYKMKLEYGYNPALIINTASTGYRPGVSLSLMQDSISFPGYIQLSDFDTTKVPHLYKDLRYYDAISTSNRFPVMSPTAQIEDEGFFLDGGYFENSGLMTSNLFHEDLKSKSKILITYPMGTVVILNGKSDYIRMFIDKHEIKLIEIKESTNTAAIIAGITNIDKLPNVLLETEEMYKNKGDSLFRIYLPHPISIDDIYASLGGEFNIDDEIFKAIDSNNKTIKLAMDDFFANDPDSLSRENNGIVVPPLARTLSKPAVDYETAMVRHHPEVKAQLHSIISFVKNGVKTNGDPCLELDPFIDANSNRVDKIIPGVPDTISPVKYQPAEVLRSLPKKQKIKKAIKKINASSKKRYIKSKKAN